MKKTYLIIITVLVLFSCKTKSITNLPTNVNAPISVNKYFYDEILKKSSFDQLKINSKIDSQTGSFVPTMDATIYIENNQKIWMNLYAVIINAARGIATPQGIKAYEKLNKTYIDSDFTYLNKLLNVNFIDYNSLQNLLLGKVFVPVNPNDFVLTKNAQGFSLNSSQNQKVLMNGKTSEYKIAMNFSPEYDLTEVMLQDANSDDKLQVSYANWAVYNNLRLPENVKIIIKNNKESQILIENTKFDFSKMETPYSVPSNYTKKDIK